MTKAMAISIFLMASAICHATPTVSDETAKQRYPWGLVDITCTVSGIDGAINGYGFALEAVMPESGNVRPLSHFWVVQNGTNSTDRSVHTNGNYRLLWDARADLGQVLYSNMVLRVTVDHGRVQLWEGGPYWATTNIGADEPHEHGYYFWWGDTIGYKRVNSAWGASDGSSSNFSFSDNNTPTYGKDIAMLKSDGWITADGVLALERDAAHVHWGGSWRMPTGQELSVLNSKCSWKWTTMNGVNGWLVSGTGDYVSASIFLPAVGFGFGTSLGGTGSLCNYWSSVPHSYSDYSCDLYFLSSAHYSSFSDRYRGYPVRPVQGFTE